MTHPGVAAELACGSGGNRPFEFPTLRRLYAAIARAYRLGVSLPDLPLDQFLTQTATLPRTTEAERLVIQRVGQNLFRAALFEYWEGRCPMTGITEPALLRASHIVPWAECDDDAQRLDVHNGLLLSALWDAAFDAGRVSFADDGNLIAHPALGDGDREVLLRGAADRLVGLKRPHLANLARHRASFGFEPVQT